MPAILTVFLGAALVSSGVRMFCRDGSFVGLLAALFGVFFAFKGFARILGGSRGEKAEKGANPGSKHGVKPEGKR